QGGGGVTASRAAGKEVERGQRAVGTQPKDSAKTIRAAVLRRAVEIAVRAPRQPSIRRTAIFVTRKCEKIHEHAIGRQLVGRAFAKAAAQSRRAGECASPVFLP